MDRNMLDAANGGVFMDKTPEAARNLISNIAENSKQFSIRTGGSTKVVHEIELHAANGANMLSENNLLIGNKSWS